MLSSTQPNTFAGGLWWLDIAVRYSEYLTSIGGGEGRSGTVGGRTLVASFGFCLREAFQSQTNTEKIYNKSR